MTIGKEPYQLVAKFPIEAIDSVQAKDKARKLIGEHTLSGDDCELKLQKIRKDKPPEGIALPKQTNE